MTTIISCHSFSFIFYMYLPIITLIHSSFLCPPTFLSKCYTYINYCLWRHKRIGSAQNIFYCVLSFIFCLLYLPVFLNITRWWLSIPNGIAAFCTLFLDIQKISLINSFFHMYVFPYSQYIYKGWVMESFPLRIPFSLPVLYLAVWR